MSIFPLSAIYCNILSNISVCLALVIDSYCSHFYAFFDIRRATNELHAKLDANRAVNGRDRAIVHFSTARCRRCLL